MSLPDVEVLRRLDCAHFVCTILAGAITVFCIVPAFASDLSSGAQDALKQQLNESSDTTSGSQSGSTNELTETQINGGLADALQLAVEKSIDMLGQRNGYLDNPIAKIALPDQLQTLAKGLKAVGQEELVTDFVASMNHAAEKAVPETTSIFLDAINSMTMEDGRAILAGPDDAATRYFETAKRKELQDKVTPIIEDSLAKAKVAQYYQTLTDAASSAAPLMGDTQVNLKDYVTEKGLDGLFAQMAEYEKNVRDNAAFRTTDLMQIVFGSLE